MPEDNLGIVGMTAEDRAYRGSRFSEVQHALFANPYQLVWGAQGTPGLPIYEVTLTSVLRGILPRGLPYIFRRVTERAVDSKADLRWGPDRKGYHRLLHPNGICLTGTWTITEDTGYSGYFANGSQALIVGRYSTCCSETRRGHTRSLSLVGKLFPTTDANHTEPLRTANFFTQQDIGGEHARYINDAVTLNAPNTSAWRRGLGTPILAISGLVFQRVDKNPSIRQLYQIAELGKADGERTRAPRFMRLSVAPGQARIEGEELDFRNEIMAQIYDRGDPQPKRTLVFHIETTDDGTTEGPAFFERRTFANWRLIGKITFTQAAASYNGDCVIHFNHPTWREDESDPATATRIDERKMV